MHKAQGTRLLLISSPTLSTYLPPSPPTHGIIVGRVTHLSPANPTITQLGMSTPAEIPTHTHTRTHARTQLHTQVKRALRKRTQRVRGCAYVTRYLRCSVTKNEQSQHLQRVPQRTNNFQRWEGWDGATEVRTQLSKLMYEQYPLQNTICSPWVIGTRNNIERNKTGKFITRPPLGTERHGTRKSNPPPPLCTYPQSGTIFQTIHCVTQRRCPQGHGPTALGMLMWHSWGWSQGPPPPPPSQK